MASNIANEIAAKVDSLPPERQREALALIEQLAARTPPSRPHVPRAERKLKGATAQGVVDQRRRDTRSAARDVGRI